MCVLYLINAADVSKLFLHIKFCFGLLSSSNEDASYDASYEDANYYGGETSRKTVDRAVKKICIKKDTNLIHLVTQE